MKRFKSFETERLNLNPTSIEDAQFIFELLNSPKFINNIGDRNIKTLEDAKTYILEKTQPQFNEMGFGNYTMKTKSDGIKIGTCGLYKREGLKNIDIGFALLPEYERKGYAYEAANRLKRAAFNEFQLDNLLAITTIENNASQNLITKLGLKLKGTTILPNDNEQLLLYELENNLVL